MGLLLQRKRILFFTLVLLFHTKVLLAQIEEYTLKAVYVERIVRFLEWPEKKGGPSVNDYFVIGVLGENHLGKRMEEIFATRKMKNKKIKVRFLSNLNNIDGCHLLYISPSKSEVLTQVLIFTRKKPIVTVSDTQGFANKGVLINLFLEKDKLRFEINERGFHEAGISIDSLLLKVAKIVNPLKVK